MKKLTNKQIAIISVVLILAITSVVVFICINNNNKSNEDLQEENWENQYTQIDKNEIQYQDSATVDEIKKEIGLSADSNLYEINTEYDGRKILNIKASVQYKIAFAGIIKKEIPNLNDADTILQENHPDKNGIWIEKNSKQFILELINKNTNSEYEIDSQGYLKIKDKKEQNDNDKSIEKWINGNKKIILTKSNIYYQVDEVTGEIVEYPFEQLDPYQTYDQIKSDDNIIIVITSNSKKYLKNDEILNDVLQCEL